MHQFLNKMIVQITSNRDSMRETPSFDHPASYGINLGLSNINGVSPDSPQPLTDCSALTIKAYYKSL